MKAYICPICKSKTIDLIEVWDGSTITWEVIDGKFNKDEGNLEPGSPVKVEGHCKKCDHRWTFRNIFQVTDIIR